MSELFYPQLSSGAIAQYPLRKQMNLRTIQNIMHDGRVISFPDSGASTLRWDLAYLSLSQFDVEALKALFDACVGQLQPFTFLDPTGNLLTWSSDLANSVWQRPSLIKVVPNISDPFGGLTAFTLTNDSQAYEEITQALIIPANYQYCLSLFAKSSSVSPLLLSRNGASTQEQFEVELNSSWQRVHSSGRLNDGGNSLSVGLRLAPGQSVTVFGIQLEAQSGASFYKPTANNSGLYSACFWATEEIAITVQAPNSYSTLISLQTTV